MWTTHSFLLFLTFCPRNIPSISSSNFQCNCCTRSHERKFIFGIIQNISLLHITVQYTLCTLRCIQNTASYELSETSSLLVYFSLPEQRAKLKLIGVPSTNWELHTSRDILKCILKLQTCHSLPLSTPILTSCDNIL